MSVGADEQCRPLYFFRVGRFDDHAKRSGPEDHYRLEATGARLRMRKLRCGFANSESKFPMRDKPRQDAIPRTQTQGIGSFGYSIG